MCCGGFFADSGRLKAGIGGLKGFFCFFPVLWERPAHTQNGGGAEALRPRPPWRFRAGAGGGGGGVRAARGWEGPSGWSLGAPGINPGSGGSDPGCCRLRERTGDHPSCPGALSLPLMSRAGINIPYLCFPGSASQIPAHRYKSCGCTQKPEDDAGCASGTRSNTARRHSQRMVSVGAVPALNSSREEPFQGYPEGNVVREKSECSVFQKKPKTKL